MLGKLLKHEWKAIWKVPVLLIGILMAAAVMAGSTFLLPIWDSDWIGLPLSGVMLIMMFYVAILTVSVGITIYFAVRYYKSMFTDEGYLTNTLPVSSHQLLLSKAITMMAWNLISILAIVLSVVIFAGIVVMAVARPEINTTLQEFVRDFVELDIWDSPYMREFNIFCVSIVVLGLAGSFSGTMEMIGAITLGQMVRKHRILGAIGAYFAFNSIIQIISTAVLMPIMFSTLEHTSADTPFPLMSAMYLVLAAISVLIGIGLYFLSEYLIRKQLELE
ncbi:MAG: hypothetical protein NC400_09590 [Clostridium sp.]|nr:hypothetical protein [Clostridium sp.]